MKVKDLFREVKYPIELFDVNGNQIYWESSNGYCFKKEYDSNGNCIYNEDSIEGIIIDKRNPVEMSVKEIEEKLGIKNLKVTK